MAKLFFLVSGEHQSLPISEVEAILKAEEINYKFVNDLTQVLQLEANVAVINPIIRRSALTRVCCQEIFNCEANIEEIMDNISSNALDEYICDESFVVRVKRVKNVSPKLI